MRVEPLPRYEAFDIYWKFAAERQRTFQARIVGAPCPWTQDPIIQEYKFCNVFRAADRVSQYMIGDVVYNDYQSDPPDRIFQIVAFRTFSRPRAWDAVCQFLGRPPQIDDLADGTFLRALELARAQIGGLYTGAFILCATDAYGQGLKHRNHVELFRDMFIANDLATDVLSARSLQEVYNHLHRFPLMGDFMSYQTAIDLNYSSLVDFDEDEFTQPGPGALRGIKKCFVSLGGYTPTEVIHWMVERQEAEFERLGLQFDGLWGRRLHAIDAQGLFCETDKYCRVALPEILSARKRIKARFSASPEPLPLFFPPKWGINHLVPATPVGSEHEAGLVLF